MKSKYLNTNKYESGIGLVEIIASLGIAVIVLTALVSLALFTVRSSLQSKLLLEGTKQSSKQIELVRAYRDSVPWTTFIASMQGCSSACFVSNTGLAVSAGTLTTINNNPVSPPPTPPDPALVTTFFKATDTSGNAVVPTTSIVKISVEVKWRVGTEDRFARNYTYLSNWRSN